MDTILTPEEIDEAVERGPVIIQGDIRKEWESGE